MLNLGVNLEAPGPFQYIPENNTLTNNTEVHLAPQFINQTTGNGSMWNVVDINSGSTGSYPGQYMELIVGDTIYFSANDGTTGTELWAHDTSNHSTWQVADIAAAVRHQGLRLYMEILSETHSISQQMMEPRP